MKNFFKFVAILTVLVGSLNVTDAQARDEKFVKLDLKDGSVYLELYPEKAPNHVAKLKERVSEGFYDGIPFHRVIPGFMAQGGDGSYVGKRVDYSIKAEFNDIKHVRGVLSAARTSDPNSASTQFFIMFDPAPHLDGQYSAYGRVVKGMELVDNIKQGDKMIAITLVDEVPGMPELSRGR